jgi:hypothetical protein
MTENVSHFLSLSSTSKPESTENFIDASASAKKEAIESSTTVVLVLPQRRRRSRSLLFRLDKKNLEVEEDVIIGTCISKFLLE